MRLVTAGIPAALLSVARRSAEEWVTDDWAAIANAINQRVADLGLSQRDVIERSHVSKAIVGEIQNNTVQRHRSPRTLKALSLALEWHPDHLAAVLTGLEPPRAGEPTRLSEDDVPGHLAVVEHYLRKLLDRMDSIDDRLDRIADEVQAVNRRIDSDPEGPKR